MVQFGDEGTGRRMAGEFCGDGTWHQGDGGSSWVKLSSYHRGLSGRKAISGREGKRNRIIFFVATIL